MSKTIYFNTCSRNSIDHTAMRRRPQPEPALRKTK